VNSDSTQAVIHGMDGDDLWKDLQALAAYGRRQDGGVRRLALDANDVEARVWLIEQGRRIGCDARVDGAANVFLQWPGVQPDLDPVVVGSHLDTQPAGGVYDGAFGVLAGLQMLKSLHRGGVLTRRPIELVSWTNEEGVRFVPGTSGSACFTGRKTLEAMRLLEDECGTSFGDAVDACLARLDSMDVPRSQLGTSMYAFLEAHIEQGPVLERGGHSAGVVTGIQGVSWYRVTLNGRADHAGTTPRSARADALEAACMLTMAMREACRDPDDCVRFTVGRFQVSPGSVNTVPNQVIFTADLRHPEAETLDALHDKLQELAAERWAGCQATLEHLSRIDPVDFSSAVIELVETSAGDLNIDAPRLTSGAFHDAIHLAEHCPTGMVFIPCENGVSHHPAESITPRDALAGTRLLAATALRLANQ